MESISIILFGYNESKTIENVFINTLINIQKITNDFEIIIIDDGSSDNSTNIINDITLKYPFVISIFNNFNLGIGKTLLKGYKKARKDNICCLPLDGQFDPKELLKIKDIDLENNFISFYRINNFQYSIFRKSLSKINFLLNFLILGIYLKDVNWVKIYKNKHLKKINISLSSSLIETEICAKLIINKINPIQIESLYLNRAYGESKINSYKILSRVILEIPILVYNIITFRIKKLFARK